jgi:hypothetical protein
MKQTTKRFLSMILGLVFLVASLIVYFEFIQPAYENAQTVKGELLSRQALLDSEKTVVKQVQNLISTYKGQGRVQEAVSAVFPTGDDLPGALAQIYGLAENSGLSVQSISISGVAAAQRASGSGSVGAQTSFGASLQKPVKTINFQAKLSGSYEDLKGFLAKLETNIRIFDVKNLGVQPLLLSGQGKATSSVLYGYDLTATTYYQEP